jgi:hypothetical protein
VSPPEAPETLPGTELWASVLDSAGVAGGKAVPSARRRAEARAGGLLATLLERAEAERKRGHAVWIERFDLHVAGREP